MNLFEFSKNYLVHQTLHYFPNYDITELDKYLDNNIYSYRPYFNAVRGRETVNDVMNLFAMILQNRFNLPNVINYKHNYSLIQRITHNFDIQYLRDLKYRELTKEFYRVLKFKTWLSWQNYCQGLVEAAQYLNENFITFNNYLDHVRANTEETIGKLCSIRGIGEVMARNFLKELGLNEFGKPDVHLLKVFGAFDPVVVDVPTFDTALTAQATKCRCTPYALDRIIWLICSGKYFLDGIKIGSGKKSLRDNFIKAIKDAIDKKVLDI